MGAVFEGCSLFIPFGVFMLLFPFGIYSIRKPQLTRGTHLKRNTLQFVILKRRMTEKRMPILSRLKWVVLFG